MNRLDRLARHREYQRQYKNRYPLRVKASAKRWRDQNPEKVKRGKYESRKANPETHRKYGVRWARSHPIHKTAWEAVYRAVKTGKLVKPESCESCAVRCDVEAHHPDYREKLKVIWLCEDCHRKRHKR